MSGRALLVLIAALVATALLVVFGLYNRGNPIVLDFGFLVWRGEAVLALYGAVFLGLLAMFLLSLPADLAARSQLRRLRRRVRDLEAGGEAERSPESGPSTEAEPLPPASRAEA